MISGWRNNIYLVTTSYLRCWSNRNLWENRIHGNSINHTESSIEKYVVARKGSTLPSRMLCEQTAKQSQANTNETVQQKKQDHIRPHPLKQTKNKKANKKRNVQAGPSKPAGIAYFCTGVGRTKPHLKRPNATEIKFNTQFRKLYNKPLTHCISCMPIVL